MSEHIILIADDDNDLVELLACRCRSLGIGVETASDSMAALGKMDRMRPDLVILDVNMPGGNGLSVRELMADNEQLASVPVIILTGKSDEDTIRRCHNSCAYYVAKCPDVWPRIEPVLREVLGCGTSGSEQSGNEDSGASKENHYEQSDQKALFDWMFDVLHEADMDAMNSFETGSVTQSNESGWVLCIDDDSEFSFGLQLRLQEYGYNVLRSFEGMEGYRDAFISGPRAIILDYEMPNGNGDYVLRRLKESPATRDIPVIVLTGHQGHAVERKMYNLGADEFLKKPCPWNTLWQTLQRYLEPSVLA